MRIHVALLLVVLGATPGMGQSRDTICLHIASDALCTDMALEHNAASRRLSQTLDSRMQHVCRSVFAERFYRDCAGRAAKSAPGHRGCEAFFKRLERTYRRDVRAARAAGADVQACAVSG